MSMKGKQHIARHTHKKILIYTCWLTEIFLTLPFICLKPQHLIPNHTQILLTNSGTHGIPGQIMILPGYNNYLEFTHKHFRFEISYFTTKLNKCKTLNHIQTLNNVCGLKLFPSNSLESEKLKDIYNYFASLILILYWTVQFVNSNSLNSTRLLPQCLKPKSFFLLSK